MIPLIQKKISTPDGLIHGSCFRTCLASILEIDVDLIPAFEDMGTSWHDSFFNFLQEQNLELEGTGRFGNKFHDDLFPTYEGIDGYIVTNGSSPREWVTRGHSVIYKNGVMVHDPHPSGEGLKELQDYWMIKRK
jgi:hypothetical protein